MFDPVFPLYRNIKKKIPIKGDDYSVDTQRAVVQRQGIMRSRARIELPWQIDAVFEYDSKLVSIEVIKTIAEQAGKTVGIGDYNVFHKGWYGRFEVLDVYTE
jgi:hypothetical protein